MNILLWVLQVLMALVFLAHGLMLLFPPASLVAEINANLGILRYVIGVAEVLGGIGLVIPGITRILPQLVPTAAAGLTIIMIGATVYHIRRGEVSGTITTAILLAIVAYLAYARWKVRPIPTRPAR